MTMLFPIFSLAARIMIAAIFVFASFNKLGALEGTAGYMASVGLPAFLVYPHNSAGDWWRAGDCSWLPDTRRRACALYSSCRILVSQ
jgi:hypothetical protein